MVRIEWRWPWSEAAQRVAAAQAASEDVLAECQATLAACCAKLEACEAAHKRALQCALAAGEAADVATAGGVGDRRGGGLDDDLATLDTLRGLP